MTTTIPSVLGKRGCHRHRIWADLILITFSGLAVVIGIIFYLSNINSPLCRICGEATSRIDKRIFLLKNNGEDQKISNEVMKPKRIAIGSGPNEVLLYVKISFLSRNLFTPVNCSDKIAKSFL